MDPLIPGPQDPQARLLARVAALESQMQQQQVAKGMTVQPIQASIQTPGPTTTPGTFIWRGGRLWVVASFTATTFSAQSITAQPTINGVNLPRATTGGSVFTGTVPDWPLSVQMLEVNPVTYALGPSNLFSFALSPFSGSPLVLGFGLFIEWPVA